VYIGIFSVLDSAPIIIYQTIIIIIWGQKDQNFLIGGGGGGGGGWALEGVVKKYWIFSIVVCSFTLKRL